MFELVASLSYIENGRVHCKIPDLEQILGCPRNKIDLTMLGDTFLDHGWLRPRDRRVKPTCYKVGLGDIGYMTEDDEFVIVDNVYNLIVSDPSFPHSKDGGKGG